MPGVQRSAGSTPVHHVEGYSWISPERFGEFKGTCLQGSALFIFLQQQRSHKAVDIKRKVSNQPTKTWKNTHSWVGQIYLPSVRETGVTSLGYRFLSVSACWGLDMYRWTHIQSVWKAPLVAIGLQIILTMTRKNQPGSACQAPL